MVRRMDRHIEVLIWCRATKKGTKTDEMLQGGIKWAQKNTEGC